MTFYQPAQEVLKCLEKYAKAVKLVRKIKVVIENLMLKLRASLHGNSQDSFLGIVSTYTFNNCLITEYRVYLLSIIYGTKL